MNKIKTKPRIAMFGLIYVSTLLFTPIVTAQNAPSNEQIIAVSVVQGLIDSGMTGDALSQVIAQVAESAARLNPSAAADIAAALTEIYPSSAARIAAAAVIYNPSQAITIAAAVAAVNPSAASEINGAIALAMKSATYTNSSSISSSNIQNPKGLAMAPSTFEIQGSQTSESTVNSVQLTADVIVNKLTRDLAVCNGNAVCQANAVQVAEAQALASSAGSSQVYALLVNQIQAAASPN